MGRYPIQISETQKSKKITGDLKMKIDVKGKKIHAIVEGDKAHSEYYALIMNPSHDILYHMTGKYKRFETLMTHVEKWAKDNDAKELSWDSKLKKSR